MRTHCNIFCSQFLLHDLELIATCSCHKVFPTSLVLQGISRSLRGTGAQPQQTKAVWVRQLHKDYACRCCHMLLACRPELITTQTITSVLDSIPPPNNSPTLKSKLLIVHISCHFQISIA